MNDFKNVKAIAEQMLALSAELLRIVDIDETERQRLIESVKKTPTERYYTFRA